MAYYHQNSNNFDAGVLCDPDLEQFFDSLVWEEWEPPQSPRGDPITLSLPVEIHPPQAVLDQPPFHGVGVDPELNRIIHVWPQLGPATRRIILETILAGRG